MSRKGPVRLGSGQSGKHNNHRLALFAIAYNLTITRLLEITSDCILEHFNSCLIITSPEQGCDFLKHRSDGNSVAQL